MDPRPPSPQSQRLRARQRLGKYRIETRLAQGGYADVYRAYDTIEGIRVALRVPRPEVVTPAVLEDFRSEVRLTARLEHPNILPIKNADFVEGRFVIVSRLGDQSLAERLTRRISFPRALDFAEQLLAALDCAHAHSVMHCDVKPDNLILFRDRLRLTDFGISKIAFRTMQGSGSGTIGFMAPEQAMGRPSFRSDVFAAGLILYRLFAGTVPEWPFEWPPPRYEQIRKRLHPEMLALLRKSLQVDPRLRFADCTEMSSRLDSLRSKAERFHRAPLIKKTATKRLDWRAVQLSAFNAKYRKALAASYSCGKCARPVSEAMLACPWCGAGRTKFREETRFPASCKRCGRGVKLDWAYCAWCYGGSIGPQSERRFSDKRYSARCSAPSCRGELMPFMRYCPWCRTKVRKAWGIPGAKERCPSCEWGALHEYWKTCPWCAKTWSRNSGRRNVARART